MLHGPVPHNIIAILTAWYENMKVYISIKHHFFYNIVIHEIATYVVVIGEALTEKFTFRVVEEELPVFGTG